MFVTLLAWRQLSPTRSSMSGSTTTSNVFSEPHSQIDYNVELEQEKEASWWQQIEM